MTRKVDETVTENLKPRRGMVVVVADEPGRWQVLDPAPKGPDTPAGSWWLTPWDEDARAAPRHARYGSYRAATYRTMKPANGR